MEMVSTSFDYVMSRPVERNDDQLVVTIPPDVVENSDRIVGTRCRIGVGEPLQDQSNQDRSTNEAPVEKGNVVRKEVVGVGHEGDPYIRIDGYIVFIKNDSEDIVGDTATVRIKEAGQRCGVGVRV